MFIQKPNYTFSDLIALMAYLRSPDGCPWDGEQTHSSIRQNLLEEAYEVAEAIDTGNTDSLCEELGDLLLQIVFHADIAEISIDTIAHGITAKLVSRHPHLFGDVSVDGAEQVLLNWEHIKRQEKAQLTLGDELRGIARSLPALMRAQKMCKKLQRAGDHAAGDNRVVLGQSGINNKSPGEISKEVTKGGSLVDKLWALCHEATAAGVDLEQELYARCEEALGV